MKRRATLTMNCHSSCTLAKDRHIIGIASKVQDISLHPFERQNHILHAVVSSRVSIARAHETQNSQSIVDRDKDHVIPQKQIRWKLSEITAAIIKRPSVDPHHNRSTANNVLRVDVQEETVLIPTATARRTRTSVLAAITHSAPTAMRNRITEPEIAHWRFCKGNSSPSKVTNVRASSPLLGATHLATLRVDHPLVEGNTRGMGDCCPNDDDQQCHEFDHFSGLPPSMRETLNQMSSKGMWPLFKYNWEITKSANGCY